MKQVQRWFLAILAGVAIMLGGLVWDAAIHATEHAHLVVEALFDPANPFENPAHLVIGAGLVWTVIVTCAGFTWSWLDGTEWRMRRRRMALPIAVAVLLGAAGVVALAVLAQTS